MTLNLNKITSNSLFKNKAIFILILAVSSILFTFYSGYRGIYPIDSFLIFDSGYKVLNDIHPFKDYWSISGPFLDYIQSLLFSIFKLSWFSYVLHSALINCLLSLVCFFLFTNIGLNYFFSSLYAISISILAYPSVGTPFMDHHGVIFSLISISFLILAFLKDKKKFWFLSSLFIVFSFFSKQIPSAYISIILTITVLIYLSFIKEIKKNNFIYFLIGGFFGILLFLIIFIVNNIPVQNFLIQYIYYPMTIGEARKVKLTFDFNSIFLKFKFIYFSLIPFLIVGISLTIKKFKNIEIKKDILIFFFVLGSIGIFIYSQLLTQNQILIFFLIPFCLALSHSYILKYFNIKIINFFIIFFLIAVTLKYHLRYNVERYFMELKNVNFETAVDAKILDKKLHGLKWITPEFANDPSLELNLLLEVKNKILSDNTNKIIIGEYQILPAITNNVNYVPNKWLDSLSIPRNNNKYFKTYKNFFISKLRKQNISTIYVVGNVETEAILKIFDKKDCTRKKFLNRISAKIIMKDCF